MRAAGTDPGVALALICDLYAQLTLANERIAALEHALAKGSANGAPAAARTEPANS